MGDDSDTIRLAPVATSPRRARLFVDEVLHRWRRDGAIERMALIASELVTNAVRHAKTDVIVHLEKRDGSIYLEVVDGLAARPKLLPSDPESPSGHGLPIVEALASSWGVALREGGKAVWAEVAG